MARASLVIGCISLLIAGGMIGLGRQPKPDRNVEIIEQALGESVLAALGVLTASSGIIVSVIALVRRSQPRGLAVAGLVMAPLPIVWLIIRGLLG